MVSLRRVHPRLGARPLAEWEELQPGPVRRTAGGGDQIYCYYIRRWCSPVMYEQLLPSRCTHASHCYICMQCFACVDRASLASSSSMASSALHLVLVLCCVVAARCALLVYMLGLITLLLLASQVGAARCARARVCCACVVRAVCTHLNPGKAASWLLDTSMFSPPHHRIRLQLATTGFIRRHTAAAANHPPPQHRQPLVVEAGVGSLPESSLLPLPLSLSPSLPLSPSLSPSLSDLTLTRASMR